MKLKKILSSFLAVTVMGMSMSALTEISSMCTIALAVAEKYGDFKIDKYSDHIEIIQYDGEASEIVIPSEIDGLPVTSIGNTAFAFCASLEFIIIPDSVLNIGDSAFTCCGNLKSITIPNSVNNIGGNAFAYTPWLENKQKENPLVVVNDILIDGTTCLGDIVISDSITSIGSRAFYGCRNLTSISISDSVMSLGDRAFNGCEKLMSITILNSSCEIDDTYFTISNGYGSDFVEDFDNFDGTIYGYENSTAQAYAEKYERKFVSLGEAHVSEIAMGDINGDKSVDSSDASDVLADYSLTSTGKSSELTDAQKDAADVDKDGKIDSSDASFILQFYSYISTGGTITDMSKWMNK